MMRIKVDKKMFQMVKPDTYGYATDENGKRRRKRLALCRCAVPCQRTFRCNHPLHTGRRLVPYCNGAPPEDYCNECWLKPQAKKRKPPGEKT